jgi:replication initiator protein
MGDEGFVATVADACSGAGVEDALGGRLHRKIEQLGTERARELAATLADRLCIDAASSVLADEDLQANFVHAGFALTALPHRRIAEPEWVRTTAGLRLRVESGKDESDAVVGIPYGSVARMILLYLQTEAVRTRSREVELGRSMNGWLTAMGVNNGGKGYALVREQSRRLSLCRLTFYTTSDEGTQITNGGFVRSAILPSCPDDDGVQLSLWRERVVLDEVFYDSLLKHPLPVREAGIRGLANRSMAIDIYVWLCYRLWQLRKPTRVPWPALYGQFGGGFTRLRAFRQHVREPLALALSAYPEARVEVDDEAGLLLHPSPPAMPRIEARRLGIA